MKMQMIRRLPGVENEELLNEEFPEEFLHSSKKEFYQKLRTNESLLDIDMDILSSENALTPHVTPHTI